MILIILVVDIFFIIFHVKDFFLICGTSPKNNKKSTPPTSLYNCYGAFSGIQIFPQKLNCFDKNEILLKKTAFSDELLYEKKV